MTQTITSNRRPLIVMLATLLAGLFAVSRLSAAESAPAAWELSPAALAARAKASRVAAAEGGVPERLVLGETINHEQYSLQQHLREETIKARIAALHAQGMKAIAYTDLRLDFGFRVSELFRLHPEWCNWDANDFTMGWSAAEISRQLREDDAERFDPKEPNKPRFGARGVWGPQTGTPAVIDYHAAQLVASAKHFNWDGFRYDDPYDYDFAGADLLGRRMPFTGFTAPVILARLPGALASARPGMIYGHNMEWVQKAPAAAGVPGTGGAVEHAMALDTPPEPNDYYTEHLRDDGLHLQERVTAYWGEGAHWEAIAENMHRLGHNAARRGGHAYAITKAHDFAIEARTLTAIMLASRVHLAYWASDWQRPYLRLAARHCDLLYGESLQPAPAEMVRVAAGGGREPWWPPFVPDVPPPAVEAPAPVAGATETLVLDAYEAAGISGFRKDWDRPIPLRHDGATRVNDRGQFGKGDIAVWDDPEKPGALAFDAVHRSLLLRFPDAAERIAAALAGQLTGGKGGQPTAVFPSEQEFSAWAAKFGRHKPQDMGEAGLRDWPLRTWAWFDGSTQTSIDHYYISIDLSTQLPFAAYSPTVEQRLMGQAGPGQDGRRAVLDLPPAAQALHQLVQPHRHRLRPTHPGWRQLDHAHRDARRRLGFLPARDRPLRQSFVRRRTERRAVIHRDKAPS